jgi:tRNA uridine 5-carbamoylmethylation protein Kti12
MSKHRLVVVLIQNNQLSKIWAGINTGPLLNLFKMEYVGDLILLRGLPGSGKSTLGEVILKTHGLNNTNYVLSADDFFIDEKGNYNFDPTKLKEAHNSCQLKCAERMKLQLSKIVIANTFTQEWEMDIYFEMAERYHYRVHTIIVENRHGNKNIHGVPEDKLQIMKDRFNIEL